MSKDLKGVDDKLRAGVLPDDPEAPEANLGKADDAAQGEEKAEQPLPRFTFIETTAIFEKLEPPQWACERLGICPGRPVLVQGFGGSGKTIAVQAMALAMAAGRQRIWDDPSLSIVNPLRVVHIDYDQGTKPTMRRYQRLAAGLEIPVNALGDRLRMVGGPEITLEHPKALEAFVESLQGADVCIIDSLRGAIPTADENSSDIRVYINKLREASERLRTSFIVIHHEGKSERSDARHAGRGSSGIFDGGGSVIRIEVDPKRGDNAPVRVSQAKNSQEAMGPKFKPFWIHIDDRRDQKTPDGMPGLAVVTITEDEVDRLYPQDGSGSRKVSEPPAKGQAQKGSKPNGNKPRPGAILGDYE